jgi:hypothetical protein
MKVFRVTTLVIVVLFAGGIVAGQEQSADSVSCALWLQWAEKDRSVKPGDLVAWPSAPEEAQKFVAQLADAFSARGIRQGYSMGVFATIGRGPSSHIRDVGEFVTALDALCAGAPQKRLLDVALHALGRR